MACSGHRTLVVDNPEIPRSGNGYVYLDTVQTVCRIVASHTVIAGPVIFPPSISVLIRHPWEP